MHMYTYLEVEGVAVVRVKLIKEMVEEFVSRGLHAGVYIYVCMCIYVYVRA